MGTLAAFRIPLEDILSATKNFAQENLLKHGEKASVYKGLLLWRSKIWINVVIRRFGHGSDSKHRCYDDYGFQEEVMTLSSLKHRNLVSFIGFCDEEGQRMIVMEHVANGSLDKYISDPTTLTWSQRLHICFGAAHALEYLDHGIISSYIKGFKILLDEDWEAKVQVCTASLYDTEEYAVHSLGVILLEVLYGRKVTIEDVNQYRAKNDDEVEKELDDIIDPNLRKQMLLKSLSIFSETTYSCLKKQPKPHPSMYKISGRLREAFEIQWKHENLLGCKWVELV